MMTRKEYMKIYCKRNKEKKKEYDIQYRLKNKDRKKQNDRNWRKENREKMLKRMLEYNKNHPDIIAKSSKKWVSKNRERVKKVTKKWQKNNPEKILNAKIRQLKKYAISFKMPHKKYKYALIDWSKSIRKINGNHCAICGSNHKLNSHHIFYKKDYPELSLNTNNGIPLCKTHHLEVHRLNG